MNFERTVSVFVYSQDDMSQIDLLSIQNRLRLQLLGVSHS